jgi:Ti-type conjugative transfer relaxase TraA
MAIYHFSGTIISRSQGRSAVACAAYRSGEKLFDERYQKIQDYTKKQDVVYKNILVPNDAPEWVEDRERLWNEVEKVEKRKDAQLAREFNFSLPKELGLQENIKLTEEFSQKAFVERGMVVDLAIHADLKSDGAYYHAHVMLTTRTVNQDGFGQKARTWNSKDLLLEWRQAWAEDCNRFLALNGLDLRVDHRSLVDQAIPLEPQHKIGPEASKEAMVRFEDHQRIARENGERLLQEPQIALKAITQQQSTFTLQDLARFINRHTVDAEQFTQVFELVKSQSNIVNLGLDEKQQERFSIQEMINLESKMLGQAKDLMAKRDHAVMQNYDVTHLKLTVEQQTAFEHLTVAGDLKCLIGYAGTGKSYLLGATKEAWEQQGFRVQGVTLSGIAAESLESGSGINSRTLASRSYYWDRGEQLLSNKDIVVVDEAGMLGSRQLARIVDEVTKAKAKLVLVGDPQQLQAIEAGAAFRAISEQVNYVELTEIRRQKESWQQQATKEFATKQTQVALDRYVKTNHIHEAATRTLAKSEMINMWNDVRLQLPGCSQIMLAYTRDDVKDLNEQARNLRQQQGELGKDHSFKTFRGERNFAIHDRVYFLKNDRNLGVMNGSLGTITNINPKALTISLDDRNGENSREVVVDFDLYNHVDHGYAATIHKAQGVTVDRSYLLASKYLDSHATYVGMSRHRDSVDLFYSREEFPKYNDLVNTLARSREKDISVDYVDHNNFANYRGIELTKEAHSVHQSILDPLAKSEFPFRNKFSNLEGFKDHDQTFKKLRSELTQKFAEQDLQELGKQLKTDAFESNFDFDQELNKIRVHNQSIEQQVNQHKVNCLQYSIVEPQEVVRGIVGKNVKLPNGKQMIEIIQGKDLPSKLVPEHQGIKTELGKEVELKFDEKGAMANIKNSQTLQQEVLMRQQQEQQKEQIERHREIMREKSRDWGLER